MFEPATFHRALALSQSAKMKHREQFLFGLDPVLQWDVRMFEGATFHRALALAQVLR